MHVHLFECDVAVMNKIAVEVQSTWCITVNIMNFYELSWVIVPFVKCFSYFLSSGRRDVEDGYLGGWKMLYKFYSWLY